MPTATQHQGLPRRQCRPLPEPGSLAWLSLHGHYCHLLHTFMQMNEPEPGQKAIETIGLMTGWWLLPEPEVPEPEPVVRLTPCEQAAIRRANPTGDPSAHTYHVAVVSFGCGRTAGQVLTVLGDYDDVTRERWGATGRAGLAAHEARVMLPRAKADAGECVRGHARQMGKLW
jgi:hypothetical protein